MPFKSNTKPFSTVTATVAAALVVVVLILSGEAQGARPAAGGDPCARSDNPALCRSVTRGQRSPVAATQAAVRVLQAEAAGVKGSALRLKNKYPQVIDVCSENYDSVLDSLRTCLADVAKRDKGGFNSFMSSVITDLYTCDDTFQEMGVKSPLARPNARLSKIASTALYLATLW